MSAANYGAAIVNRKIRPPTRRAARLLTKLLAGSVSRERLQDLVGASNLPDQVARARKKFGLTITCEMHKGRDRDGQAVKFGVYSLTDADRIKVQVLLGIPGADTTDDKRHSSPPSTPQGCADTTVPALPEDPQQGSTGLTGASAPGCAQEGTP